MLVYRLEHDLLQCGPFHGCDGDDLKNKTGHQWIASHANPWKMAHDLDTSLALYDAFDNNWRFGWNRKELMQAFMVDIAGWNFYNKHGYVIRVYDIGDHLEFSDGQVLFNPESSQVIETIKIFDFLNDN